MRKSVVIISTFIFSICFGQKIDTLTYLKKFETNKAKYIGKPFSILVNDLGDIQPKTVWSSAGRYINFITASRFEFTKKDLNFSGRNIILSIQWQHKKISRESINYYGKKNNYHFTEEEKEFYSDKIINNIIVYKSEQ